MLHTLLERIRAEYLEMPGMRLTLEQAQRLCGLERASCQVVLGALLNEKFLYVTSDGHYVRTADGERAHPRTAKADLRAEPRGVKAS